MIIHRKGEFLAYVADLYIGSFPTYSIAYQAVARATNRVTE